MAQVKKYFSEIFDPATFDNDNESRIKEIELGSFKFPAKELSDEAKMLLVQAADDDKGRIVRLRLNKGLVVKTNGQQLCEMGNPRSEAKWDHAVNELLENGYIQDIGGKGEVFVLTQIGYEKAERLTMI